MSVIYNVTGDVNGPTSVTAFIEEGGVVESHVAAPDHPNWHQIIPAFVAGDVTAEEARDLFDIPKAISKKFERLGEQVTIKGNQVFFDGDPVDGALADTIVTYHTEGHEDLLPLVNFMEKIASNPDETSRESLYGWMRNKSFSILPDGNFLAYKGVTHDLLSIHGGKATVNGEDVEGQIPNEIGNIIEMPRSSVDDNRGSACSTGLHVGTFSFARNFGQGPVLTIEVNPRDVVSVPMDANEQKMRVCRYTVVDIVTEAHDTIFVDTGEPEPQVTSDLWDRVFDGAEVDDEPECPECGEVGYDDPDDCPWCEEPLVDDSFASYEDDEDDEDNDPLEPSVDRRDLAQVNAGFIPGGVKDLGSVRSTGFVSGFEELGSVLPSDIGDGTVKQTEQDRYMDRLRTVENLNRDTVRWLAKETGVTRGLRTKGQLAVAIVDKEFGR